MTQRAGESGDRAGAVRSVLGDGPVTSAWSPSTVPATLVGPDGEIVVTDDTIVVNRPTWIAAVARASRGERTPDRTAFAHTTAVRGDVDGSRRTGRRAVPEYRDRLRSFLDECRDDLVTVLDEARAYHRRVTTGGGFG